MASLALHAKPVVPPGYSGSFRTTASEKNWIFVPNGWKYNQSARGIIFCHGSGQDASVGAAVGPDIAELTGCVACCPDLAGSPGGAAAWGNDSSLQKITNQWTILKNEYGVKTDKMILTGLSMGTATALMYALANPSNVAALELELPAVNVDSIRDADLLGQQSEIDDAYGGSVAWETAKTTRDPILNIAGLEATGIPIQIWYGDSDAVCLPEHAETFIAGITNIEPHEGIGFGHDVDFVDIDTRAAFLNTYRA